MIYVHEKDEIKPCPFCDGRAKLVFIPGDYGYTENMYKVECTKCGASIIRSEKCVNDAWNRRVGDEG